MILLVVHMLPLLRCQLAAVCGAIVADLAVQIGFARFQILGFPAVSWPESTPLAMRFC